jgi:hypothetical protein
MHRKRSPRNVAQVRSPQPRRAMVLILVLVVVAVLILAAYSFSELMYTENKSARVVSQQGQARALVESGADMLRLYLAQTSDLILQSGGTYDNATQFQNLLVSDRGRVSIVAPKIEAGSVTGVRFGLENDSARLNINALAVMEKQKPGTGKAMLMTLPNMDDSIADAILDWLDADDTPRENGAEADYYSSLSPPYAPKNGPIETVEELLKVRGVTPQLLFGADANRNGIVDANEQANASLSSSGADPETDRGWAAYLTIYSRESNLRPDGTPKINLAEKNLQTLHDELAEVLTDEETAFIMAYLIYGPAETQTSNQQNKTPSPSPSPNPTFFRPNGPTRSPFQFVALLQAPSGGFGQGNGGGARPGGPQGGNQNSGNGGQKGAGQNQNGGRQGGQKGNGNGGQKGFGQGDQGQGKGGGPGGGKGGPGGGKGGGRNGGGRKGGGDEGGGRQNGKSGSGNGQEISATELTDKELDLTKKPKATISSILDLIGAKVEVQRQGPQGQTTVTVKSAFGNDATSAGQYLTDLLDNVSTSDATSFPGRININQASRTLLLGIPGLTADKVESIIGAREPEYSGNMPDHSHETWLFTQGILTLDEMKAILPYITVGGSVYRAQIVGYFDQGGSSCRAEVIIDSSPPKSASSTSASDSTTSDAGSTASTGTSSSTSTTTSSTASTDAATTPITSIPRIVFWRDMTNLGRGFPLATLGATTE